MSDKTDVIYDMLKDMANKQETDREKSAEWREKFSQWTGKTDQRLENLEEDMRLHIEGVMQNRKSIEELGGATDQRLKTLEEPGIFRKHLKKIVIGLGAIAGSLAAIFKFLELL